MAGLICGLTASAATGSAGRGIRAAMTRHDRHLRVTWPAHRHYFPAKARTFGTWSGSRQDTHSD
jgi:hypothetical protein